MARDCGEVRSATRRRLKAAEVVIVGGLMISATMTVLYTVASWAIG